MYLLSALLPLYPLSPSGGSVLPNLQPDSSYQRCAITMNYVTTDSALLAFFLPPYLLDIAGKIVIEGPEQGRMMTAMTILCQAKKRGSGS